MLKTKLSEVVERLSEGILGSEDVKQATVNDLHEKFSDQARDDHGRWTDGGGGGSSGGSSSGSGSGSSSGGKSDHTSPDYASDKEEHAKVSKGISDAYDKIKYARSAKEIHDPDIHKEFMEPKEKEEYGKALEEHHKASERASYKAGVEKTEDEYKQAYKDRSQAQRKLSTLENKSFKRREAHIEGLRSKMYKLEHKYDSSVHRHHTGNYKPFQK